MAAQEFAGPKLKEVVIHLKNGQFSLFMYGKYRIALFELVNSIQGGYDWDRAVFFHGFTEGFAQRGVVG